MIRQKRPAFGIFLALALTFSSFTGASAVLLSAPIQAEAAAKIKLNKTKLTLSVGKTFQFKLQNATKKISWKSSAPGIVKISSTGKATAKKAGAAKITAKSGKKTYICSVTVKKAQSANTADPEEAAVLKIINQERASIGLSSLKMNNASLNQAADIRAKEIASYFSHTRPNGSDCFSILEEKKIFYWSCGENIAAGQRNASEVMVSWMNSPGHKANILNSSYDTVGIGHYYNPSTPYQHYWVQLFIESTMPPF